MGSVCIRKSDGAFIKFIGDPGGGNGSILGFMFTFLVAMAWRRA